MFGYVKPDNPNMYVKDTVLYRSLYCGLCKAIGKTCGTRARFCLSYDLTFLSALLHNIVNIDVKIEKQRCIIHWFKKRPVAVPDALTERIARLNLILTFHKLNDDVIDSNKGRIKRWFFKRAYKKAVKSEPQLDQIAKKYYAELLNYEKSNGDSVDLSADAFSTMMQLIVCEIVNDNDNIHLNSLAYNLGKWVYLIDALDDFEEDVKKGNYNVFANAFNDSKTKCHLIENHGLELQTIFAQILSDIAENGQALDYKFNHDLTDNIMFRGLNSQTKNIMECKKCKKITKS